MNKEQQYWSLNGSFEALVRFMEYVNSNEVVSKESIKNFIMQNMGIVHKEMEKLEN